MPDDGWVPVANTTAQGRRLSWRAKGLLVDLLSYPDGYRITFKQLMDEAKKAGDPDVEGRDAMRKSMQELERKGYLKHQRVEVKDPAPGGQRWRTETFICDQPIYADRAGGTGPQDHQDSGPPDFSSPEDQELFNNTSSYKTNQQQEEAGKSSSALAAARAGEVARERELPPDLKRLYDAADKLDDDRLRRLLLQFERKRPQIYRQQRQKTLTQLGREDPEALQSVREVDLLSFKYALQHYRSDDKPLPVWLTRFPR
ncbi:hypothetical protein [Streptomyces liliifuscus]|uniref:Helix-turn-helix domain-containing protein n=1 Tax=Streptomyces liliifuscus TaxID=2797636 RepID=A0A7T7L2B4_9ACTN|nr:hypothetical protein [Streptomyces liliifuscus]QQM45153.1 hypothetical protein JEQ17_40980 [Streptomyces liliifuscus]